jgi:hypothetical protein
VGVPGPDPHVFGTPLEVRIGLRIQILPFSHKGVEQTEIMLEKLKIMASNKKKYEDTKICILKVTEE